jgi:hypothetical protein
MGSVLLCLYWYRNLFEDMEKKKEKGRIKKDTEREILKRE